MKNFLILFFSVLSFVFANTFASEDFNINLSTQEFQTIKKESGDFMDIVILAGKLIDYDNKAVSGIFPNIKLQIYDTTLEIKDNKIVDVDGKENNKAYLLLSKVVSTLKKKRPFFNIFYTETSRLLSDTRKFRIKNYDALVYQKCGNIARNRIVFSLFLLMVISCAGYVYRDTVSEVAGPYVVPYANKFNEFMQEKFGEKVKIIKAEKKE